MCVGTRSRLWNSPRDPNGHDKGASAQYISSLIWRGMKAPASRRGSSVTPSRGSCPPPRGQRLIWLLMVKAQTEARDVWVDRSCPRSRLVQRLSTPLWASRWIQQRRAGPMACGVFLMIRPTRLTGPLMNLWELNANEVVSGGRVSDVLQSWYREHMSNNEPHLRWFLLYLIRSITGICNII